MHFRSVQLSKVKITAIPTPVYEAFLIVVRHFVKQPESLYEIRSLVPFTAAAFQDGILMYLAVVAPYLFLVEIILQRLCQRMPADASRIYKMCFGQAVPDAGIFREIPISQADIRIHSFQLIVKCPSHDTHKRSVSKCHPAFDRLWQLYRSFVIVFVAGLTERNQVIGSISAYLPAFDMVHIENLVL